ncbi:MAG: hypothetical protein GQF41_3810 [Candidatus Rifleibacterium amylolyticum]|nr:MAG: hypothetical protein GQF41_3810 [Candidatus Rifleibacterium amylolyticum]
MVFIRYSRITNKYRPDIIFRLNCSLDKKKAGELLPFQWQTELFTAFVRQIAFKGYANNIQFEAIKFGSERIPNKF